MNWISVKDRLPYEPDQIDNIEYVLAYHTIHGIGVAWIWKHEDHIVEELEEEFGDKYVCSCIFIKNKEDGDCCIDSEDDIDVFEHSPHFFNLGTVTHWMPLPLPPEINQ